MRSSSYSQWDPIVSGLLDDRRGSGARVCLARTGNAAIVIPTPRSSVRHAHVAILLATYNGDRFLGEQLESLRQQQVDRVDVWASDDGSSDGTIDSLQAAEKSWNLGRFQIVGGPRAGFAENFRSLILNSKIAADYYAFCDQDDLWDEDKLAVAVDWLKSLPPGKAGVYCSRTRTIDLQGRPVGLSPLFSRPPSFRNAIVQSIAGANTMVLNQPAWALVKQACRENGFVSHDWWTYLIVTGAGGEVHYCPQPRIGYRQHAENIVGSNTGMTARLSRYRFLLRGRFSEWMGQNLTGLRRCEHLLTDDARTVLAELERVHSGALPGRLAALMRSGAYRQSLSANLGLYAACLLGKL
jgi:glycosyltransferase involved in cell wall biosynthesis